MTDIKVNVPVSPGHSDVAAEQKNSLIDNQHFLDYISSLRASVPFNKRVLLIQAPQFLFESFNRDVAKRRGYYAFPPTALQCIAKSIHNNFEVKFLDLNYELLKRVIQDDAFHHNDWLMILEECLQEYRPSIIGVTCLTAYTDILAPTHPLTSILQLLQKKGNYLVIVGGPTVTNESELYLKNDICHFVVTKEGEGKFEYLFNSLIGRQSHPVGGVLFKSKKGIEQTRGKDTFMELRGSLKDTYNYFPIERYKDVGSLNPYSRMAGQDTVFGVFQFNRGCRGNCRFCDVTKFMGRGTRHYPVDDVIEDITYLVEQRGVRHFEVLDDDFLANKDAVAELLNRMILLRERYGITWAANNGLLAMSLTEEIMALLRDSGCIGFRIGIESGNPDMLRKVRKPATLPLLKQKGELIQKFPEMFIGANYIIGLFGEETFGQMLDTLRFSCEMNLDWSSITVFQFTSKETAIVENLKSKGGNAGDFIPAKDSSTGEIQEEEGVLSGPAIFGLPEHLVPVPAQVKQIWFTFNLLANYLNNKNLKPGGRPEKLFSWVEAVQVSYPNNPYMSLFAALAHLLKGSDKEVKEHLEHARSILTRSAYWTHRFSQFGLLPLLDQFPQSAQEAYGRLEELRRPYLKWIS